MHVKPQPNTCDSWWEIPCFGQCSIWAFDVICLNLPYAACCFFCNELIWRISRTEKTWKISLSWLEDYEFSGAQRGILENLSSLLEFLKKHDTFFFWGRGLWKSRFTKVPVQHGSDCLLVCVFFNDQCGPFEYQLNSRWFYKAWSSNWWRQLI